MKFIKMYTKLKKKGWVYVIKEKAPKGGQKPTRPRGKMPGRPKPKNMKKTLGNLLKYVGKHKALLFLVMILVIISSFAMVANSYFLKPKRPLFSFSTSVLQYFYIRP